MAARRSIALFSSVYILVDVSLEIASQQQQLKNADDNTTSTKHTPSSSTSTSSTTTAHEPTKKLWHHILASAMAGGIQAGAAGLSTPVGSAIGCGLGLLTSPIYKYAYIKEQVPSLLMLLRQQSSSSASISLPSSNITNDSTEGHGADNVNENNKRKDSTETPTEMK